ncbi:translocation protein TolB [Symmachiella dynata]|uniref:WD40 repeat domain-containing protein n=1 Tax=Symmachiella dynata TaxID=2527995 RepID=UPI00118BB765|nr:WD40 repeat domain-containing protein [Symmachiella dynata]QDT49294.1 translocation protein TolB [Symmachiella dynata]
MWKQLTICGVTAAIAATLFVKSSEPGCGVLRGHTHEVFTLAFAPDGKTLASGSGDFHLDSETEQLLEYGELKFWNMDLRTEMAAIESTARFWAVAFSPDGKLAVTGGGVQGQRAGVIQVWDWQNKKQLATVTQDWLVQSLAISPDGKRLATVSYGSQAILWDLPGLENPVVLEGHTDDVKSVAFSPDGWSVATGSWDGTVKLWDVETARCTSTLQMDGTARSVSTVAFSPDGETIAAGCGTINQRNAQQCGAVTCWEIASGTQTVTLPHNDYITSLVFSPDRRTLISGSRDGLVRLWDYRAGTELKTITHAGPIESIAISNDAKLLATAGRERECAIRLWNVELLVGEVRATPPVAMVPTDESKRR